MNFDVVSTQNATLLNSFWTDIIPSLAARAKLDSDLDIAFSHLQESSIRTRVNYLHKMGLVQHLTAFKAVWEQPSPDGTAWKCLTPFGATVGILPSIVGVDEDRLRKLFRFLTATNSSLAADADGQFLSAPLEVERLRQSWPANLEGDGMRDDVCAMVYRITVANESVQRTHHAFRRFMEGQGCQLELKWNINDGVEHALSDANHLPGFQEVTRDGNSIIAKVELQSFIRAKQEATVAYPFTSLNRSSVSPSPNPRYPNYIYDAWASCSSFTVENGTNGAELLKLWDTELNGGLANIIGSSQEPLGWVMRIADRLPSGKGKKMAEVLQEDLRHLLEAALGTLAYVPKRIPTEFDVTLRVPNLPPDSQLRLTFPKSSADSSMVDLVKSVQRDDCLYIGGVYLKAVQIAETPEQVVITVVRP